MAVDKSWNLIGWLVARGSVITAWRGQKVTALGRAPRFKFCRVRSGSKLASNPERTVKHWHILPWWLQHNFFLIPTLCTVLLWTINRCYRITAELFLLVIIIIVIRDPKRNHSRGFVRFSLVNICTCSKLWLPWYRIATGAWTMVFWKSPFGVEQNEAWHAAFQQLLVRIGRYGVEDARWTLHGRTPGWLFFGSIESYCLKKTRTRLWHQWGNARQIWNLVFFPSNTRQGMVSR